MPDLAQLSDEELRAALFDALVERIDAKAHDDATIAVVNRMPTVYAVSRRGNLLTLSQGIGARLLRGDLKWKDRREQPRTFNIVRATIQTRLAITPDRIEGTPDEILNRIVAMFLEWTAAVEEPRAPAERAPEPRPTPVAPPPEPRPAPAAQTPLKRTVPVPAAPPESRPAPRPAPPEVRQAAAPAAPETRPSSRPAPQESRPAPRPAPHKGQTIREAMQERRAASAAPVPQERRPAAPKTIRESRPAPVEVTEETRRPAQVAEKPSEPEPTPAPPPPVPAAATGSLRTYQLLFETARRELDNAKSLPGGSMYFLISAGVFTAFTAEAFFNDLGSRVIPSWSQMQRLDPREKAEVLSIELFNDKVDWSTRPFQSVAAALGFRRALANAHAETLPVDHARTSDRGQNEVPRTRRTAWQEHCDVTTIQRWITDVRLLIEHFSQAYDANEVALGATDQSASSTDEAAQTARKKPRPGNH